MPEHIWEAFSPHQVLLSWSKADASLIGPGPKLALQGTFGRPGSCAVSCFKHQQSVFDQQWASKHQLTSLV